jgi:hypothetical protein
MMVSVSKGLTPVVMADSGEVSVLSGSIMGESVDAVCKINEELLTREKGSLAYALC